MNTKTKKNNGTRSCKRNRTGSRFDEFRNQLKSNRIPLLVKKKTRVSQISTTINVIARDPYGSSMDLDNTLKKENRSGNALKEQIKFVDELFRQIRGTIALGLCFFNQFDFSFPFVSVSVLNTRQRKIKIKPQHLESFFRYERV